MLKIDPPDPRLAWTCPLCRRVHRFKDAANWQAQYQHVLEHAIELERVLQRYENPRVHKVSRRYAVNVRTIEQGEKSYD